MEPQDSVDPSLDIEAAKRRIGERVRELRGRLGITTRELARLAGVTGPMVSQLERGQVAPSLATLLNLASVLGVDVGELVGAQRTNNRVVRRDQRRTADYPEQAYRDEWLSGDDSGRLLVLRSIIEPGGDNGADLLSHRSEVEFVFVLSGSINIFVDKETIFLDEGDALTFASNVPHGFANPGDVPAELIWVETPATY